MVATKKKRATNPLSSNIHRLLSLQVMNNFISLSTLSVFYREDFNKVLSGFCCSRNHFIFQIVARFRLLNTKTKLDRSVYFLNSNTPHSTPQALNPLKSNTLPRATFGRGSGRKGINFSGCRQGFRLVLTFPQSLRVDLRTTSREPSNSLLVGLYVGLLSWLIQTHHGLRRLWVPLVLNWLSDFYYCDKSWLKILKYSYLQYISIGVKIRDIKSLPPPVEVWRPRPKGDKFKTTLVLPTLQVMSNLTPLERYSQAGRFNFLGIAIATLTLALEGGEG